MTYSVSFQKYCDWTT